VRASLPEPADPDSFARCRLDWSERERPGHAEALALHRDLIRLRRQDPTLSAAAPSVDAAPIDDRCAVIRWFDADADGDRLLVVNLGADFELAPPSEPLLAPPPARCWAIAWSSEDIAYGGRGTPPLETPVGWRVPGPAAVLLVPVACAAGSPERRANAAVRT